MSSLIADLRYAWRRVLGDAGTASVAILSIALGVGASTAIFGAVDRILLSALPYPGAERIVVLTDRDQNGAPLEVAYGHYLEIAQRSRSFEALAVADRWQPAFAGAGEPERLEVDLVSADYFRVFGVLPSLGRDFTAADDVSGAPRVVVVAASFANRRFGGADAVLNRTISLEGNDYTVIGVMPGAFEDVFGVDVEVWSPRRYRAEPSFQGPEWGHNLRMVGRLRPGVTLDQAQQEIVDIGRSPAAEFPRPPWASLEHGLVLESLHASITSEVRPALLAIFGAVLLLLAIACANVTNLLLARALARRRELAMRAALGASRGRLARQLFTESALLAVIGGALGLGIAALGGRALTVLAPVGLSRLEGMHVDARLFAIALSVTALVAFVVGLVPVFRVREIGSSGELQTGARATASGLLVLRRSLVVAQVAFATVLLAGAGLLLRSVDRLLAEPTGFDGSRVVAMQVVATGDPTRPGDRTFALFERVLEAARAVPGVVDAALTSQLPLSGDSDAYGVVFESVADADPAGAGGAFRYAVTPDWFETMGIPLKRGRSLDVDDRPGAPPSVLINESFAARRFAGRDPLGERIRIGPDITRPDRPWATVVGIVGDVKQTSLASSSPDAFYVAMGQWAWIDEVQWLVVRTAGAPEGFVEPIKRAVWSIDSTLPLVRTTTMTDLVARSEAQRTFALTVFAAFGLVALLLAAVGVYGVIEARVVERTREIGLRSALGATPTMLAALVVGQGLFLTMTGISVGVITAAGATRGLESLLYGVAPFDPVTYVGVAALLVVVSFVACYAPALRATRIDPAVTLRSETRRP